MVEYNWLAEFAFGVTEKTEVVSICLQSAALLRSASAVAASVVA